MSQRVDEYARRWGLHVTDVQTDAPASRLHFDHFNTLRMPNLTWCLTQMPLYKSKVNVLARQALVAVSLAPEISPATLLHCERRRQTELVQRNPCICRHCHPPIFFGSVHNTCLSTQRLQRRTFTHNALNRIGKLDGCTAETQESRRRRRAHAKYIETNATARHPGMRAISSTLRSSASTGLSRCDDANSLATTTLLPQHSTTPQHYARPYQIYKSDGKLCWLRRSNERARTDMFRA